MTGAVVDNRVDESLERRPERVAAAVLEPTLGISRASAEIRAGAEGLVACARDDDGAQGRRSSEMVDQLVAELSVQRVAALRSIDDRDTNVAGSLPANRHLTTRR